MAASIGTNVVIISIVFSISAIISVFLRFRARLAQRAHFGADDYTVILALVLSIGVAVANCVSAIDGGLGTHVQLSTSGRPEYNEHTVIFMKCLFCTTLLSTPALAFAKCSIIFFYRRIFRGHIFNVITTSLLVFVMLWGAAMFLGNLLTCRPVSGSWEAFTAAPTEGAKKAKCFNPVPKFYVSAICDLAADVMIFVIPQPMIWKLQMPKSRKIGVSAIFVLGAFVVGISAARISFFVQAGRNASHSYDVTYDQAPTLYWTQLECSIAVICACLPTLRITAASVTMQKLRSYASKVSLRHRVGRQSSTSSFKPPLPPWDGSETEKPSMSASSFPTSMELPLRRVQASWQPQHYPLQGTDIVVQKDIYQQHLDV